MPPNSDTQRACSSTSDTGKLADNSTRGHDWDGFVLCEMPSA